MCLCLSNFKLKSRIVLTVLVLLIVAPLIGHYYLSKVIKTKISILNNFFLFNKQHI